MRRHQSAAQPVEIARQAVDAAKSAVQNVDVTDVRDTVAEVRDTVANEVTKDYEMVLDETRRRPLRALLIALGIGALVGAAADRMKKRRKAQEQPPQSAAG